MVYYIHSNYIIRLANIIVAAWLDIGNRTETYIQTNIVYHIHSNRTDTYRQT